MTTPLTHDFQEALADVAESWAQDGYEQLKVPSDRSHERYERVMAMYETVANENARLRAENAALRQYPKW